MEETSEVETAKEASEVETKDTPESKPESDEPQPALESESQESSEPIKKKRRGRKPKPKSGFIPEVDYSSEANSEEPNLEI